MLVFTVIIMLAAACTPDAADDLASPTVIIAEQKTELEDDLETPEATQADDLQEKTEPTEAAEEVKESASRQPALGRPASVEAEEEKPTEKAQPTAEIKMLEPEIEETEAADIVAPSGSVDLGDLPPTPSDQTEPGNLVIIPAPGSPDPTSKLVEQAKSDLSERMDFEADEIEVVSVENVNWSNGSLGCPEQGMMYIQAITPGYLIVLEADGQEYEYHTNTSSLVKLCQDDRLGE